MNTRYILDALAAQAYQYREEEFELKSGQKSHHYVDCRALMLEHYFARLVADLFAGHIAWTYEEVGFVAGVVAGGCSAALGVGKALGDISTVFVRPEPKTHGMKDQLILPAAMKLDRSPRKGILVEDVITTGGSSMMAIGALEEAGHRVQAVYCLVNRSDKMRLGDVPIHALTTLEALAARAKKQTK